MSPYSVWNLGAVAAALLRFDFQLMMLWSGDHEQHFIRK